MIHGQIARKSVLAIKYIDYYLVIKYLVHLELHKPNI